MQNFDINNEFNSFADLLAAKKAYENASKSILTIADSRKLKGNSDLVKDMIYHRLELHCKAGKERPSQSNGLRRAFTMKKNCKVKIIIVLKNDKLKVTFSNVEHKNHLLNEQTFYHYPENMRLSTEEENEAKTMIAGDSKKYKIKAHLMSKRIENNVSSPISLKSIHNVGTKVRLEKQNLLNGENELEKLLDSMLKVPGAKVTVLRNDNDELLSIFFQDKRMAEMFDKYPELILFDATYRMNNRQMPIFIQAIVDGNGITEIVSIWICKSESHVIVEAMLDAFKQFNPSWTKVKCIIGDKDFADRAVYLDKFPGAVLQICLFHVMQAFNREITTGKRNITQEQRKESLEILQQLCYAQSEEYYDQQYEKLCCLKLDAVTDYFNTNWHNIRDQWSLYGRNKYSNYLNSTNNRTERLNGSLKMINSRNANLLSCFENISTTVSVLASEKDIKAIRINMCNPRNRFTDDTLTSYQTFLTPFIFTKIQYEYEMRSNVVFESCNENEAVTMNRSSVTSTTCSCAFYTTMNLPCKHIFKFCEQNGLDLFLPQLCSQRWTKRYYDASHPAIMSKEYVPLPAPIYIQQVRTPHEKDKYKAALNVTKEINSLVSTLATDRYTYVMEQLKQLKDSIAAPVQPTLDVDSNESLHIDEGVTNDVPILDAARNEPFQSACNADVNKSQHLVPGVTNDLPLPIAARGNIRGHEAQIRQESSQKEESNLVTSSHVVPNETHSDSNPPNSTHLNMNGLHWPTSGLQSMLTAPNYMAWTNIPQWVTNGFPWIQNGPQSMTNGPQWMANGTPWMASGPQCTVSGTPWMANGPQYTGNGPQLMEPQCIPSTSPQSNFRGPQYHHSNTIQTVAPQTTTNTLQIISQNSQMATTMVSNESQRSGNGSQLSIVTTAHSKQLSNTILPTKHTSIGRPKGSVNTVIGTKRKNATQPDSTPKRLKTKLMVTQRPNRKSKAKAQQRWKGLRI